MALSGGPDSTALLASLAALRDRGLLADLRALHVDHGLRPGSERDGAVCEASCERLGVALRRVRVAVQPGNVQAMARRARYAALRAEAAAVGATRVATGHTRDDQAETVLLRLLRGSGARGLSGIPPRRGAVVRPLIDAGRDDVMAFLVGRGLAWIEDPSNATPRFLRNRVRGEVLPVLRALAPHVAVTLARAADLLRDDDRALAARGRRLVEGDAVALERLRVAPVAVRRRAVRALWGVAGGGRAPLGRQHVERILALLDRPGPGRAPLPGGLEASMRYGFLRIRRPPGVPPGLEPVAIAGPGRHPIPGGEVLEVGEAPEAAWPLWWRARRPGDRFRPEGGRGAKKLKAWLIDRKVPRELRDGLRVLADDDGQVIWIPALDVRASEPKVRVALIP